MYSEYDTFFLEKERVEKARQTAVSDPCAGILAQTAFDFREVAGLWNSFSSFDPKPTDGQPELSEQLIESLKKGLYILLNHDYADLITEAVQRTVSRQIETGIGRRSFRSDRFEHYDFRIKNLIKDSIRLYYCKNGPSGFAKNDIRFYEIVPEILAVKINRHDPAIINCIAEMIEGDNNALLSRRVIQAVLLSDHEELKDRLLQLLKGAGLQEGLRQSILESADIGDLKTFKKIFGFCIENDLFRFSSSIRACFTWCGCYAAKIEPESCKDFVQTAYHCLMDPAYAEEGFQSSNPIEVYLSLWALANIEIDEAAEKAQILLNDLNRQRKMAGWFFIEQIPDSRLKNTLACAHLNERDTEILAYMKNCLYTPSYYSIQNKNDGPCHSPMDRCFLPQSLTERKERFYQILDILNCCGSKNILRAGGLL